MDMSHFVTKSFIYSLCLCSSSSSSSRPTRLATTLVSRLEWALLSHHKQRLPQKHNHNSNNSYTNNSKTPARWITTNSNNSNSNSGMNTTSGCRDNKVSARGQRESWLARKACTHARSWVCLNISLYKLFLLSLRNVEVQNL